MVKVKKTKVISMLGTLGLTAGALSGCGAEPDDDDLVKVVDSEGKTVYIDEDELEDDDVSAMFIPFVMWNGKNHTGLKSSSGYKGKTYTSLPSSSKSSSSSSSSKSSTSGGKSGLGGSKGGSSGG